jgi:hypothetical protein
MPTPSTPAPVVEEGIYWIPEELRDAYHLSLGRFIDAFGLTEATLAAALHQFMSYRLGKGDNLARHISRAILGSKRVKELSEIIKRVLHVIGSDEDDREIAREALNQLSHIQHVRDRIAHNGAGMEFYGGAWMIRNSNHNQVRDEDQIEQLRLTIEDMDNMTEDLWQIQGVFRLIMLPHLKSPDGTKLTGELPPWQYKPSALKRHRRSSPSKRK